MVIPEWTIGDRFRKARSLVGLGQREFAALIGVGAPAYAQWEADNSQPRNLITVAQAIERVAQVPAWWLLGVGSPVGSDAGGSEMRPRQGSNLRPTAYAPRSLPRVFRCAPRRALRDAA